MATWSKEQHGEWTCSKCGRVYLIECNRYPARDDVRLACECGELIFSGRTTHDYFKTFRRQGDPADAAKNPVLG
jgi:hypothetical protein